MVSSSFSFASGSVFVEVIVFSSVFSSLSFNLDVDSGLTIALTFTESAPSKDSSTSTTTSPTFTDSTPCNVSVISPMIFWSIEASALLITGSELDSKELFSRSDASVVVGSSTIASMISLLRICWSISFTVGLVAGVFAGEAGIFTNPFLLSDASFSNASSCPRMMFARFCWQFLSSKRAHV